ncbi:hypothetical protein AGENTSMITH_212 [Bacillus phage vB_BspM_AgentSmith]|nr:hypothetical protein AGENTSMITH_212 [Bacillus phage vB_BspM_AgentSmith]
MSSYDEEGIRLLDKTVAVRERMIDHLLKSEELPTKARDVEKFVTLLDSTDKSIFTRAKIKLEESNQKTSEESKELLRDLLLSLHQTPKEKDITPTTGVIPQFVSSSMVVTDAEIMLEEDEPDIEQYLSN